MKACWANHCTARPTDSFTPRGLLATACACRLTARAQITAVTAAQNICSALFARERTGRGQHVEVAMLDSALFFMWPEIFGNYTFMGDDAPEPVPEGECCTWLLAPDRGFARCILLGSRM